MSQSSSRSPSPWLIVALGFLVLAVAFAGRATLSLVMPDLEAEMGWTRTFLSSIAAASLVMMAGLAPFAGRFVDRHGARLVLVTGMIILGLGCFAVALSHGVVLFILAFAGLFALGQGLASMSVVSTAIAQARHEKVGFATGIATSGATAGQILILPLIATIAIYADWRWCFAATSLLCFLLVPFLWRFMPGRPADTGQGDASAVGQKTLRRDLLHILKSPTFHLLFWSFFICGYTTSGVIETHFLPFASFCGFGRVPSAAAFGALSVANLGGMILVGWLTDRMNRPLLLGLIYLIRGLSFVLLLNIGADYATLVLFAVIFGTVDFSTVPVTASLVKSHLGLHVMGLSMGLISAGHAIGAAIGAFLGGYLFDLYSAYYWVWLSSMALAVLAGLMVFLIRQKPPTVVAMPA
ncbi:MAG: MFS transporter [Alphaproteobacteria bacterium]|nr:MFS transporter [Rhodospirillaceae bacterium]MBT6510407.1 MFS transporter [Rhodospirillaceae bacterium]MBT7615523.1 MFS transporter [Rhodospirillaceae bacterium]MBT7645758.1 MFS transporter [Rhodospirillaceae bacterium]MDG2479616.1 MFS transporter [Alphaproteobacteria bacterium]